MGLSAQSSTSSPVGAVGSGRGCCWRWGEETLAEDASKKR